MKKEIKSILKQEPIVAITKIQIESKTNLNIESRFNFNIESKL
jgi:hypothetical protein